MNPCRGIVILHKGVEVPVCAIEHVGIAQWTFQITARDPEKHLLSWNLGVVWGETKSENIVSGNYSHDPVLYPSWEWDGISREVPNAAMQTGIPPNLFGSLKKVGIRLLQIVPIHST